MISRSDILTFKALPEKNIERVKPGKMKLHWIEIKVRSTRFSGLTLGDKVLLRLRRVTNFTTFRLKFLRKPNLK